MKKGTVRLQKVDDDFLFLAVPGAHLFTQHGKFNVIAYSCGALTKNYFGLSIGMVVLGVFAMALDNL